MYCIKCGVELADSEKKCPLCFTTVYNPEIEQPYAPPFYPDNQPVRRQTVSKAGAMFIVTAIFALGVVLPFICDLSVNGGATWSGFSMGGVLLLYILAVLPTWFKNPNPVVFVPCDFAACLLYLMYICIYTGGRWFMTFALPVVGALAMICTAVTALCKYIRRGYLYIFGGASILTGGLMLLTELLLNVTFEINEKFVWSFYPFTACLLIGLLLIVIAISPGLRTTLQKKFFV